jgi:hypothetical protein
LILFFVPFLYSSLSRLFATALPLLEASYAYGCAVRRAFRKDDSLNREVWRDIFGPGPHMEYGAEADAERKRRIDQLLGPLEEDRCV